MCWARTVRAITGETYPHFAIQFHEFISHRARSFRAIQDRDMGF
ncbi:MAG: hypothetical protein N2Z84_01400 [Atribacterota bacterium]|nr:hypothetical protein [Atribacterota bacterium]